MLTICDRAACRRDFLKIGSLALLGGLDLPQLLASRARASYGSGRPVTDKAVVLLFLAGGPSHIEMFDPKMTALPEVRSITGEVKHSVVNRGPKQERDSPGGKNMEYQCAWCRRTLAQAAASAGCTSISHGICVACMEAMLAGLASARRSVQKRTNGSEADRLRPSEHSLMAQNSA